MIPNIVGLFVTKISNLWLSWFRLHVRWKTCIYLTSLLVCGTWIIEVLAWTYKSIVNIFMPLKTSLSLNPISYLLLLNLLPFLELGIPNLNFWLFTSIIYVLLIFVSMLSCFHTRSTFSVTSTSYAIKSKTTNSKLCMLSHMIWSNCWCLHKIHFPW